MPVLLDLWEFISYIYNLGFLAPAKKRGNRTGPPEEYPSSNGVIN